MASGLYVNGSDIDNIFEPRSTTAIANTGFQVGGIDIANRFEKLASGTAAAATGYKVNGADLNAYFCAKGTTGVNLEYYAPGTYTFTPPTNGKIYITYLDGASGGSAYEGRIGYDGGVSYIQYPVGTTIAQGYGGGGADGYEWWDGADGTASFTVGIVLGASRITGGGGIPYQGLDFIGGYGGRLSGGYFNVSAGQSVRFVIGSPGQCGTDYVEFGNGGYFLGRFSTN